MEEGRLRLGEPLDQRECAAGTHANAIEVALFEPNRLVPEHIDRWNHRNRKPSHRVNMLT